MRPGDLPPVLHHADLLHAAFSICSNEPDPALCATILKAAPEGGHKPNALFARFNTLFEKSTQHYTDSTRSLLRCTGRYMVVYLLICAGMAVLFLRTPTSFLPEEDQGYL